mgnify:CR=1 FL=1
MQIIDAANSDYKTVNEAIRNAFKVKKVNSSHSKNETVIISEEDWGLRKLAYPIQKKTTGFYYLMEFTGEGDIIEKLETQYRRDERVIRFLTFKMDKYAVEYAEKRRNKNTAKQE